MKKQKKYLFNFSNIVNLKMKLGHAFEFGKTKVRIRNPDFIASICTAEHGEERQNKLIEIDVW